MARASRSSAPTKLKLLSADQTVLVTERDGVELNAVRIEIDNPGLPAMAAPVVRFGGEPVHLPEIHAPHGVSVHRILVPAQKETREVQISLRGSRSACSLSLKPPRRWRIFLVHAAHFDPGYTDLTSSAMDEYPVFFDDILRYCDETDHWPEEVRFRYQVEQSWTLLHTLKNRPPATVDRLVQRLREGRIEVNAFYANMITELCGSEELARLLYPSFSLKRRYGIAITTAEHNDIPGISWGVAQALVSAGIRYFVPGLPDYFRWGESYPTFWDESVIRPKDVPTAFRWEAPDGRSVLFFNHDQGAGGQFDRNLGDLFEYLQRIEETGYPYSCLRYWLNGGGRDNAPPTPDFARAARAHNETWTWPKLRMAVNSEFFEHLAGELGDEVPTFRGELTGTDYPIGALSSARETGVNRTTHDRLPSAEKFAALTASVTDMAYPRGPLDQAWLEMLQYDEHAFGLAYPLGVAQMAARTEQAVFAYRAAALTEDVLTKSLNRLADDIRLDREGIHIVVFNPTERPRTDVVRVPGHPQKSCSRPMYQSAETRRNVNFPLSSSVLGRTVVIPPAEQLTGPFDLVDCETGQRVAVDRIPLSGPDDAVPWAADRYNAAQRDPRQGLELAFTAAEIPALGYRAYRLVPRRSARRRASTLAAEPGRLESPHYRLTFDPETGRLTSLYDKELRREIGDRGADYAVNELVARSFVTGAMARSATTAAEVAHAGEVTATMRIRGAAPGCPKWVQEITVYADCKRIDFANRLLKDEDPRHELYFAFPFAVAEPKFRYEGALSILEPVRDQLPGTSTDSASVQHFAHVYNDRLGVTWSSRDAHLVAFSEIWPGYVSQAHHGYRQPGFLHAFLKDPAELTRGTIFSYVLNNNFQTNFHRSQSGELLFRYSLTSHRGPWERNRTAARDAGWAALNPLESVYTKGPQSGPLPAAAGFVELSNPQVVLLALKRAESGEGLVLRLQETTGADAEVTIRLPRHTVFAAFETNLAEEIMGPLPSRGDGFTVRVQANGLATVLVRDRFAGTWPPEPLSGA